MESPVSQFMRHLQQEGDTDIQPTPMPDLSHVRVSPVFGDRCTRTKNPFGTDERSENAAGDKFIYTNGPFGTTYRVRLSDGFTEVQAPTPFGRNLERVYVSGARHNIRV